MNSHLKGHCATVKVFGDLYYKEIDKEKALKSQIVILPDGQLKNREDLAKFIAEKLPEDFSHEEPKWKCWIQKDYDGGKGM